MTIRDYVVLIIVIVVIVGGSIFMGTWLEHATEVHRQKDVDQCVSQGGKVVALDNQRWCFIHGDKVRF